MNTKTIGEVTEAEIMTRLLSHGKTVLIPWGDNQRYDLVIDENGKFFRVQCKTGRLAKDCSTISFKTSSSTYHRKDGCIKPYHGDADLFGVFCHELGAAYIIPVKNCTNNASVLRLTETKNKQSTRWAKDYLLSEMDKFLL